MKVHMRRVVDESRKVTDVMRNVMRPAGWPDCSGCLADVVAVEECHVRMQLHHWHPDKETIPGQAGLFIFSWNFFDRNTTCKICICIGVAGGGWCLEIFTLFIATISSFLTFSQIRWCWYLLFSAANFDMQIFFFLFDFYSIVNWTEVSSDINNWRVFIPL